MLKNLNWYILLWIVLLLEGFFPIFTYFALESISLLWLVAFSIGMSLLFWFIVFLKEKLYKQYKKKELLFPTFMSALFLWVWGLLYFFWIKYSSPSIAAILLLTQSFFAFIVFNLLWKEEYNKKQIIWAILMFIWWTIVLYEWESFINIWALIMIIATMTFTIWNYYTKQASVKWASPFFLLVNRNILMIFVTSILAYTFAWGPDIESVKQNFIWIFLIWFLVLFASKALWIRALTVLNSFVAITSFSIIPIIVLLLSFFILDDVPSFVKLLWFIPIFVWSLLLVKKK